MLHIKSAKYISDYVIWVAFDDGTDGQVNLENALDGAVFLPLKDQSLFAQVMVDPELETVVWPNGADLAPEYLKQLQVQQAQEG